MRRVQLSAAIAIIVVSIASSARADFEGTGLAHYEGRYDQSFDNGDRVSGLGLARLRLRAILPWKRGPAFGIDLAAGATRPGGFAYDVGLHVFGLGTRLGRTGSAGITTGFGASGGTANLDDAMTVPTAVWLELPLGSQLRLIAHGRAVWVVQSEARRGGSQSTSWVDEFDGMVALRVGHSYREFSEFSSGNGWFVGGAYRESMGLRFVGVVVGYSIDGAFSGN